MATQEQKTVAFVLYPGLALLGFSSSPIAVPLGDESWLSISPIGLGGAPCGAGDGASRPVRTIPTPREAPKPQ
jgi:hypothetical protein